MSEEPQRDWPAGLTELALLLDAGQVLAWAERILDRGVMERDVEFRTRLAAVRLWLEKLDGRRSHVVEAAQAFEFSLAENRDLPPMGAWPAADALRETTLAELRRDLSAAPRDAEDWRIRVRQLAALPWIGKHARDCPAGWLPASRSMRPGRTGTRRTSARVSTPVSSVARARTVGVELGERGRQPFVVRLRAVGGDADRQGPAPVMELHDLPVGKLQPHRVAAEPVQAEEEQQRGHAAAAATLAAADQVGGH